eukprot:2609360-Amphidinium_carterae.1
MNRRPRSRVLSSLFHLGCRTSSYSLEKGPSTFGDRRKQQCTTLAVYIICLGRSILFRCPVCFGFEPCGHVFQAEHLLVVIHG